MRQRHHLEELGVAGRMIPEWTLKKSIERMWTRLMWLHLWYISVI